MIDLLAAFIAACALTWALPMLSLYAFILICPFANLNDLIGWDLRLPWIGALALRGAWQWWSSGNSKIPEKVGLFWAGFLFTAAAGLTLFTARVPANDLYEAWSTLAYIVFSGLVVYCVLQLAQTQSSLRQLAKVFAVSILTVGGSVLIEAARNYNALSGASRIAGPLRNANYTAAYLAFAAAALVLLVRAQWMGKVLGIAACCAAALGCLAALSRMGAAALFAGIVFGVVIRPNQKLLSRRAVLVFVLVIVMAVLITLTYLLQFRQNVTAASADPVQMEAMKTEQALEDLTRWEALGYALKLAADHPIVGVGIGTFASRNYAENGMMVTTHNTIMQVLAGTGVVGLTLFASTVAYIFVPLRMEIRRFILPALFTLGLCCLFGDLLQSPEISMIFAVLYACLLSSNARPVGRIAAQIVEAS